MSKVYVLRLMTRRHFRSQLLSPLLSAGLGLALVGGGIAQAQTQGGIPWNHSLTITRTSSDDNIQNVFRTLLQEDGLSVTFGAGVNQTVSFHLENAPIDVAFEQLINEHHLTYSYDPSSKTVAINAAAGGSGETAHSAMFVTLDTVSYQDVVQAVGNLGLGLGGLRYDGQSRTLAISGDADRIKQVQTLIQNLEDARKKHGLTGDGGAALGPEEVKVIPLRFTDVGPSTRQFQGKTVTVPGIADTLRSALGLDTPSGAPTPDAATAAAAAAAAAPAYGHPRISIDQRTNSVVVQGSPDAIAAVEKIITQLDRPLQMVEIEVLIVTANVGVAQELGVEWRASQVNAATPGSVAVDTGTSGTQITNGATGQLFSTNGLNALSLLPLPAAGATAASFVISGGQSAIQAQIEALASQNRARILSAPKLVTLDNIAARITRSENLYVQVDTVNAAGGYGGVGLQEIQPGLTLDITPSVVPSQSDHEQSLVRLNLRAENSAPGSGSFGQIDVNSQEVPD